MIAITRQRIAESNRVQHAAELFGVNFPMHIEPFVYCVTGSMDRAYQGGYWNFYALSNGGFYMAPKSNAISIVICDNGYEGWLSADALGITACLYAYSHLSFSSIDGFAETCAQHYHLLREYMLEHPESGYILRACD